jgi:hypothetical protein
VDLVIHDGSFRTNPRSLEGPAGRTLALECLRWAWSGEIPAP